jgi:hypothetical protein
MLITHARQLCLGVADRFMTADDGIDSHFPFGLQFRNTRTRITQLACILFGFELSLGMLAGGAIALARKTLGLL